MKILMLDIETAPNKAYVWGLWQQNVGLNQIVDSGYVLCWAAKWYGQKEVMFDSIYKSKAKDMLKRIHKLLEEADVVMHYYGSNFDIPVLNREFVIHGMTPPAPYKELDLIKTVKQKFKFASNKLDYVCQKLGLGKKHHTTFELWVDCMANDPAAWKTMEKYNRNDIILLEKLYDRIRPWIKGHANHSVYEAALICPNCASTSITRRGFHYTSTSKYQRYRCGGCGNWFRSGRSLAGGPDTKGVNV
jgi:DNA polymerase elongation subunit (family B)